MTQPLASLLSTSEDLMPLPHTPDAWELLADARDQIEAAMRDQERRAGCIAAARKLLERAEQCRP